MPCKRKDQQKQQKILVNERDEAVWIKEDQKERKKIEMNLVLKRND